MQIPKEAVKKFTGVIFDVYQWEQKMFDGSTETFEMLKRPDTVQVIATADDKVFVGFESQPTKENFYALFGGRVDENENTLDAAKRELLEESGMASNDWELYKKYSPYHKIDWTSHVYIARNCQKIAKQTLDAGEKINVKELSFDDFINVVTNENFQAKEITIDILKMTNNGTLDKFRKNIFKK